MGHPVVGVKADVSHPPSHTRAYDNPWNFNPDVYTKQRHYPCSVLWISATRRLGFPKR